MSQFVSVNDVNIRKEKDSWENTQVEEKKVSPRYWRCQEDDSRGHFLLFSNLLKLSLPISTPTRNIHVKPSVSDHYPLAFPLTPLLLSFLQLFFHLPASFSLSSPSFLLPSSPHLESADLIYRLSHGQTQFSRPSDPPMLANSQPWLNPLCAYSVHPYRNAFNMAREDKAPNPAMTSL